MLYLRTKCNKCGQDTKVPLVPGMVVTPTDGSSMDSTLYNLLNMGYDRAEDRHRGFRPARVLAVEGDVVALEPIERTPDGVDCGYYGLRSIWASCKPGEFGAVGCKDDYHKQVGRGGYVFYLHIKDVVKE